ncbi:hypothetical protein AgCh_001639 [Apium graveolens]
MSCELELAGPEYKSQPDLSYLSKAVCEELFCCELSDREACSQVLSADIRFEAPKAYFATTQSVRDSLIVNWNATYDFYEKMKTVPNIDVTNVCFSAKAKDEYASLRNKAAGSRTQETLIPGWRQWSK